MKKVIICSIFVGILFSCKTKEEGKGEILAGLLSVSNSSIQNSSQSNVISLNLSGAKGIAIARNSISSSIRSVSSNTNAVVVDNQDKVSPAFTFGDVEVEKFYILKNNGVLAILKNPIMLAEVDNVTYIRPKTFVINDKKQYRNCKVLISDVMGKIRCLDYGIEFIQNNSNYSIVNFDGDGNIFLAYQKQDGITYVTKYSVEGKNPINVFTAGINQYIANIKVTNDSEVLINHLSFNTGITRFDSIKNGNITVIDSNMANVTYYFIEKFPDNKYYYTHNIGGDHGTGLFQFNPASGTITNWNWNVANWNNWTETYSGTNFCSAGNGYLVTNSSKVFYKALPQSPSAGSNFYVYQLYPKLQVLPIPGLVNIVSIYSIEDSNEILVAGYVSGSFNIAFKFLNTINYTTRDAFIGTIPLLPESVTVNQQSKKIEFIDGRKIKSFDFSSGYGVFSETNINEDLIQYNSL
ncbi:hypothetical protein ND860_18195 [Leptospira levettii]|uniref:hypothetical protein n=1 Tax=Leptospira levettii TaxID=2023178 RepID=UPI00223E7BA0|nr:hypothetical protein [Leptospira levettii]MCW7498473.1 hypothetical protein [Leptospira levettii]